MVTRLGVLLVCLALAAAACGGDDAATSTTAAPSTTAVTTTTTAPTTTQAVTTTTLAGPAVQPADVVFEDQVSDGSTIVVASVTLPAPGFIAVHGNNGGAPGPVVGHSGLLPAGTSTEVEITLDTPLEATDLLFPMAHIDVNENGEYEFFPPDQTVDGPALTAAGDVAVVGAEVTVEAPPPEAAGLTIANFSFGAPLTISVGEELTVSNTDAVPHTWTSSDGTFDSGTINPGGDFSFTFDAAGEYAFHCEIHPQMAGTITVTG